MTGEDDKFYLLQRYSWQDGSQKDELCSLSHNCRDFQNLRYSMLEQRVSIEKSQSYSYLKYEFFLTQQ